MKKITAGVFILASLSLANANANARFGPVEEMFSLDNGANSINTLDKVMRIIFLFETPEGGKKYQTRKSNAHDAGALSFMAKKVQRATMIYKGDNKLDELNKILRECIGLLNTSTDDVKTHWAVAAAIVKHSLPIHKNAELNASLKLLIDGTDHKTTVVELLKNPKGKLFNRNMTRIRIKGKLITNPEETKGGPDGVGAIYKLEVPLDIDLSQRYYGSYFKKLWNKQLANRRYQESINGSGKGLVKLRLVFDENYPKESLNYLVANRNDLLPAAEDLTGAEILFNNGLENPGIISYVIKTINFDVDSLVITHPNVWFPINQKSFNFNADIGKEIVFLLGNLKSKNINIEVKANGFDKAAIENISNNISFNDNTTVTFTLISVRSKDNSDSEKRYFFKLLNPTDKKISDAWEEITDKVKLQFLESVDDSDILFIKNILKITMTKTGSAASVD